MRIEVSTDAIGARDWLVGRARALLQPFFCELDAAVCAAYLRACRGETVTFTVTIEPPKR